MEIITKKINEVIPYENNPRKNDEAVDYVASSIKDFGFRVPIIIDKDNVIVAGHTRLKAAKQLGLKEVPCIMADDLTEEQIKAFRLADNKVGESSKWDYLLLSSELEEIVGINMSDYGFLDGDYDIDWNKDEKEKTTEEKEESFYECPKCHKVIAEGDLICK